MPEMFYKHFIPNYKEIYIYVNASKVETLRIKSTTSKKKTQDLPFFKIVFTQEWTPHILRFDFLYTVIILAAPQETVEEAGIEPGTAALQSGSPTQKISKVEGQGKYDGYIIKDYTIYTNFCSMSKNKVDKMRVGKLMRINWLRGGKGFIYIYFYAFL
jgi:hypothetical protein